jgi:two-component sensor histidine kinase
MVRNDTLRLENLNLHKLLEQAALDMAEHNVADRIRAVLMEELHHRLKNMMAIVTAIVRQSLRTAGDLVQAEHAITARLVAMSNAHALLLKADLDSAALTRVVQGAIEQHDASAGRIHVEGPEIEIVSSAILPLTMILNELCTNSTKYGALSNENGSVLFVWAADEAGALITFRWIEKDGPIVSAPGPKSFGSRLIEAALPRQLGGRGHLTFPPTGVEFELAVSMEALTTNASP